MKQKKLIKDCIKKKVWAQKELFELYNKKMFRTAYRYTNNTEDAEDIIVESFIIIFEKLHTLEIRNEKSVENWIKTIVINNCLMLIRKKKRLLFSDKEPNTEQEYRIDENFDCENIYSALMNLPAGYRTVFNLFVIEGYSHKEIAENLNISVQISKSQLSRAKKQLRESLKEYCYEQRRI